MKLLSLKILFIAALCFGIYPNNTKDSFSETTEKKVKWMSIEEAVLAAERDKAQGKQPKKVFIDVYTDWCGWCKKMDKDTFEHPEISAYLNQNFYPVKLNAEQREEIVFQNYSFKYVPKGRRGYHEFAASLMEGKMSYPTVVFLSEDYKILQRIPGYLDVKSFDMIMKFFAEEHFEETSWDDFRENYKSDF
jgi:thioredoxin-related protein